MADQTNSEKLSKFRSFCGTCGSVDYKYRCPACDLTSCSLACVKKHKILNFCSGLRDKTKYVTRKEYNEKHLLNDYRFLEEANRVADNARRDQKSKQKFFSRNVKKFKNEASKKGVKLRLMPVGFKQRMENTSCFHFKTKVILWRIKWEFPQASVEYVDAKVSENESIEMLLEKYLHPTQADPIFKQRLKAYRDGKTGVFIRNYSTQASFFKIDKSLTVKEVLEGKVVIEYPTFHVVLSDHFSEYPTDKPCPSVKRRRLENRNENFLMQDNKDSSDSCSEPEKVAVNCDGVKSNTIVQGVREDDDKVDAFEKIG